MLDLDGINYLALILAWLINMTVGALWYSPKGFAKSWTEHTGIDLMKIPQEEATRTIGFVAVSALVQAATLAVLGNSLGADSVSDGLVLGLVLWFGLTAATTVGVTLYSQRSWALLVVEQQLLPTGDDCQLRDPRGLVIDLARNDRPDHVERQRERSLLDLA